MSTRLSWIVIGVLLAAATFVTPSAQIGVIGSGNLPSGCTNDQVPVYNATTRLWACGAGGGSGAPTDATYITQTANGTLSAEQALASLSTGIMRVATTTGAVTSLTDSAGIAANISNETGTGALVFGTDPTITLTNATGLVLTTGVTNALNVQQCIVTTSTQSATSDVTLNADDTLLFPVVATGTYAFEITAFFTAGTDVDPDVAVEHSVPASATTAFVGDGFQTGATAGTSLIRAASATAAAVGGTGIGFGVISTAVGPMSPVFYGGTVTTAGTAGNVVFLWSQNTSDTTPTVRNVGSKLCWMRVQ